MHCYEEAATRPGLEEGDPERGGNKVEGVSRGSGYRTVLDLEGQKDPEQEEGFCPRFGLKLDKADEGEVRC